MPPPVAGTTRDMVGAPAEWLNRPFMLADTGGLFGATTDPLHAMVVEQGLRALQTADIVVFLVDGREGLVPGDLDIAQAVRALNRPVILVVNKADLPGADTVSAEMCGLPGRVWAETVLKHPEATANAWSVPVLQAVATKGEGIADLVTLITLHLAFLKRHPG